jgi:phosphatidate cytidylyltransferase
MLGQRLITGALLAAIFAGALVWLPVAMLILLIAGVVLAGAWEWGRLAGLAGPVRLGYVAAVAAVLLGCHWAWPRWTLPLLAAAGMWWLAMLVWVVAYPRGARWWSGILTPVMGAMALIPAWVAAYWFLVQERGALWLGVVVVVVAGSDIGAYFGGRAWGRHRLAPAVSPGKTWEGVVSGLALALVVGLLAAVPLGLGERWPAWLAVALLGTAAGVLGDLGESMVKRHHGVKDSGSLLPGHGGVLDRIDSLTAALPTFALGLALAGLTSGAADF